MHGRRAPAAHTPAPFGGPLPLSALRWIAHVRFGGRPTVRTNNTLHARAARPRLANHPIYSLVASHRPRGTLDLGLSRPDLHPQAVVVGRRHGAWDAAAPSVTNGARGAGRWARGASRDEAASSRK